MNYRKHKRSPYNYHHYDQEYFNDYKGFAERQEISDQIGTIGGQLTDFGTDICGQVSDLGSVIENQVSSLARQQGDILNPLLQNPQSFVPLAFSLVLLLSTLAIGIKNFLILRQMLPKEPGIRLPYFVWRL